MSKKILFLFSVLAVMVIAACSKLDIDKDAPDCIKFKIKDFSELQACDSAKVDEYTFQGTACYVFDPGACTPDTTSEVFNFDCVKLGALGGYRHVTTINNEAFSHAVFVKNIWTK